MDADDVKAAVPRLGHVPINHKIGRRPQEEVVEMNQLRWHVRICERIDGNMGVFLVPQTQEQMADGVADIIQERWQQGTLETSARWWNSDARSHALREACWSRRSRSAAGDR